MEAVETEADSIAQTIEISSRPSNSLWRDIFIVLIASWAVRMAFICMVPDKARSFDAFSWGHQADLLKSGINPYQADNLFNWPPLWMQCVFLISKIADFLNVPFFRVLQLFLVLVESAVIVQTMRLMQTIAPAAKTRAIGMLGIALNPVAVFLVCQHCNFDVLVALWVLLAAASLLRYNASKNLMDWLCACLFLGLGILTKTVPLAFIPLLAGGFRKAGASERLLGTTLVLGPVALGMSVIFVLAPSEVLHNVLEYRARGIFFGFPGFLHAMGMDKLTTYFDDAFYLLGIGIMVLTWRHLWKHDCLSDRETVLYIALAFLAIPGLGPGFGGQYYYWFLPFLVISYAAYSGLWRKLLIGFAAVSAIAFVIDYGLDRAYGYNFLYILSQAASTADSQWSMVIRNHFGMRAIQWELWLESPVHETMERIPLFIAMLTVIVCGANMLVSGQRPVRKWVIRLAGIYAACVALVFVAALVAKYLEPANSPAGIPVTTPASAGAAPN